MSTYDRLAKDKIDLIEPPTSQDCPHRMLFSRDPERNVIETFADIHPIETLAEPSSDHRVIG